MLPRIGLFKSDRMGINHIILVDGEVMRPVCIRMPVKFGRMLDPLVDSLTCHHCQNKGWTKSLGPIGMPTAKDKNGCYISREKANQLSTM